ncbi:MAG: glycogen/starch synthase [Bacteroidales bacterium]|nr:glycogen/starch synthase [Bacteroidales bacterium]
MSKTKILFVNSEVEPFLQTGKVAQHGNLLPQALQDLGHEIRVFMPRFGTINERRNQLHEVIRLSGQNLVINDSDHSLVLKVASLSSVRTQVYFIDNEEYFSTRSTYSDKKGNEYADQVERCLFYARGVAETVKNLRWTPDIIFCQGWFAAVAPMYIKKTMHDSQCFKNAKIFLALYDKTFKTDWPVNTSQILKTSGVTKADVAEIKDKKVSCKDLLRLATRFCDGIIVADKGVDQDVVENAKTLGKSILDISDNSEINVEQFSNFFESFFPKEVISEEE